MLKVFNLTLHSLPETIIDYLKVVNSLLLMFDTNKFIIWRWCYFQNFYPCPQNILPCHPSKYFAILHLKKCCHPMLLKLFDTPTPKFLLPHLKIFCHHTPEKFLPSHTQILLATPKNILSCNLPKEILFVTPPPKKFLCSYTQKSLLTTPPPTTTVCPWFSFNIYVRPFCT